MKKLLSVVCLIIVLCSCETHHEKEELVRKLVDRPGDISEIMNSNNATKFYSDSVLGEVNSQDLWYKEFKNFGNYEVECNGYWFDRRCFKRVIDIDGSEIQVISLISKSNNGKILEFNFKYMNDTLKLTQINYRSHFYEK